MERYRLAAIKGFTTYREDGLCLDPRDLTALLDWSTGKHRLCTVHAEDDESLQAIGRDLLAHGKSAINFFPQSRPDHTEESAVRQLLALVTAVHSVYFVHISTKLSLQLLRQAKQEQPNRSVWVETCPQYLVLDHSVYETAFADRYTVCPPLRTAQDQQALWQGIRDGLVDVIASDHCAFTPEMKASDLWTVAKPGLPAVDAILPVLVNVGVRAGLICWEDVVRVTAENPARAFRLRAKGSLTPGHDADFVVISDPDSLSGKSPRVQSRAGYSPFTPDQLDHRWLRHVVRRGEYLVRDGKLSGAMGAGIFIPTDTP